MLGAAVFVLVTAAAAGAQPSVQSDHARAVVDAFHAALLGVMREAETLGYAGRQERLDPVIRQSFDLPLMARKAAGRHWKKLEEADRRRFVDVFSRLAVTNYAARFDGWSGERFETLGAAPAAQETLMVQTQLVKSDGEPVRLDYRLRRVRDGWRIFDVFLDGTMSEVALRRAEYSSMIRREGFEALLQAIEDKIVQQRDAAS